MKLGFKTHIYSLVLVTPRRAASCKSLVVNALCVQLSDFFWNLNCDCLPVGLQWFAYFN